MWLTLAFLSATLLGFYDVFKYRRDIGHKDIKPDIRDVVWDEDSRELLIITSDRPGKSTVIGKGGWVVGRLKEELKINKEEIKED